MFFFFGKYPQKNSNSRASLLPQREKEKKEREGGREREKTDG
jgi:hypothetical protein